jgi:ornithine cyclodeaminase/alanine dehydrogenase-like protein (mu-crystallin family)
VPLYLSDDDVAALVAVEDVLDVVERSFHGLAAGAVVNPPRRRLAVPGGYLAVMPVVDTHLGFAGLKSYTLVDGHLAFVVCLFSLDDGALAAVLAADRLGRLRTGAASAVASRHLARDGAHSIGIIGCGAQAETQLAAIRAALPDLEEARAWCPTRARLDAFCARNDVRAAQSASEAARCSIVVTATTAKDPVVRGDWLSPGALVCAIGANDPAARELDDAVLARATFVCTDSREQAMLEAGDLIEPVEHGVLDWLEVHELHEVVTGEQQGRQSPDDVVVFKSNGLAAWDLVTAALVLERARAAGVGVPLP